MIYDWFKLTLFHLSLHAYNIFIIFPGWFDLSYVSESPLNVFQTASSILHVIWRRLGIQNETFIKIYKQARVIPDYVHQGK